MSSEGLQHRHIVDKRLIAAGQYDLHGLVFKSDELKIYKRTHTWGMKLSRLGKQKGTVRIVTFRLPGAADDDYYATQIARRPSDMFVLVGTGDRADEDAKARALKARFPRVRVGPL